MSSLHAAAARKFYDLVETPGVMMHKVRQLAPLVAELDALYGPGWEYREPFQGEYDRLLTEAGIR